MLYSKLLILPVDTVLLRSQSSVRDGRLLWWAFLALHRSSAAAAVILVPVPYKELEKEIIW
jgi:hypothetical protein